MNKQENLLKYSICQFIETLNQCMSEYATTDIGVWTGGIYKGIQKLIDSYVESFEENTSVYVKQSKKIETKNEKFFDIYSRLFASEDEIIANLLQKEVKKSKDLLTEQKEMIFANRMSGDDARLYLRHFLYRYMKALEEINPNIELSEEIKTYEGFSYMNITEMFEKLFIYIDEMQELINPIVVKHSSSNIQKVKQYIDNNYGDPYLSPSTIAEHIFLNASYLSTEFAKQEDITLSNYITNVRIKHAKNFLAHSEMRISEIGTAVGYINSTYFSTSFKKVAGCSPSEYRRGILE